MPETRQEDFSAGIYDGRKAPAGAVYDVQNGLVDDEGNLFRRGATAYKSGAAAAATLEGLQDVYLAGGRRTVFWSETAEDVYTLASDDSTVVTVSAADTAILKYRRGVVFHGLLWMPASKILGSTALGPVVGYGGSRKTSDPMTATCSFTNGSTTVTASGSSWLTTADAGMILEKTTGLDLGVGGVVRSITDDTHLELVDPWTLSTSSSVGGQLYRLHEGPPLFTDGSTDPVYVATAGHRLLVAQGRRVYFTPPDSPWGGDRHTDYHELPEGALIVGADALHDVALIFTTSGVWAIENLVFDVIDDAGNVQQQVEQITKDLILWGDSGIAAWSGALVVPAVDDVYLFDETGQTTSVSEAIRPRYRSYVNAGYQPGIAAVNAGHYHLPILDGSTVVDTLVCRLDRPYQTPGGQTFRPWTRWEGHASGAAYAQRVGADTREPKLLGLAGKRVTDLTATLDGQGATDADGSTVGFNFTTNDVPLGFGTATRLRATYEMVGEGIPYSLNRPDQDLDGGDWRKDPFANIEDPITITGNQYAGGAGGNACSSWLTTKAFTVPLAVKATIEARPATNLDAADYAALAFVQGAHLMDDVFGNPVTASDGGYEIRVRFESAHDTVTIERYDGPSRTRIAGPTNLGSRIVAGDTFKLTVATDGTINALVNDAVIATATSTTYFHAGQAANVVVHIVDQTTVSQSAIRLGSPTPTVTVEYSSDQDGDVFTELETLGEQGGGVGWTISDGSKYQWANVNKKRERIRFRLTLAGAATSLKLRVIDLLTLASGKQ